MKPLALSIIFGIVGLFLLLLAFKIFLYPQISVLTFAVGEILVTLLLLLNHYNSDFLKKK
jgi:hypothetical protein